MNLSVVLVRALAAAAYAAQSGHNMYGFKFNKHYPFPGNKPTGAARLKRLAKKRRNIAKRKPA